MAKRTTGKAKSKPDIGEVTTRRLSAAEGTVAEGRVATQSGHRFGPDGRLTLEGAREVIAEGGSVMMQGKTITKVEDLPSEAQLAKGNRAAMRVARANLKREIARRQEELAELGDEDADDSAGTSQPPKDK